MKHLEIYDPAMCCSSGVCGPDTDPEVSRFAADLKRLTDAGTEVRRFNLAHEPEAFLAAAPVRGLLDESGSAALPAIVVNGALVSQGRYPEIAELATLSGVELDDVMPAAPTTCCNNTNNTNCC